MSRVPYAELHAHSAYSFLDGASMPADLVARASELELDALAITDHDGLPGAVQLAQAAREYGLPSIIGSEISLPPPHDLVVPPRAGERDPNATHLLVLARSTDGYSRLSHALGRAMLNSGIKGVAHHSLESLAEAAESSWLILTGCRKGHVRRALEGQPGVWAVDAARAELDRLTALFGADNVAVEISDHGAPLDRERNEILAQLAHDHKLPLVATGNVHSARPADKPLADVLAAVRSRSSLEEVSAWLPAQGTFLRSGADMARIHSRHPQAVATAAVLGVECAFDFALVAPKLPEFPVPPDYTEASWLRELTYRGAADRYGSREEAPEAWRLIEHELAVIEELDFPGYFLIVHDIVDFCRREGIFCQGRGSAANSAVCFTLGITAVDAVKHKMLFERFLSPGRSGPPDIDVDIESQRREEVIQHVYERYGRDHAAQVANVITYRPRSAVRDAARAFGFDQGQADAWAKGIERWGSLVGKDSSEPHPPDTSTIDQAVLTMAERMLRLPRHLGIHSGGMVLCEGPVINVCPVGWATMPGRTVLQWDKDDCAEANLVKFDLLGLGMLTALRLSLTDLVARGELGTDGRPVDLHTLPQDDDAVYDLLCDADTVGVFQVESRAQMATLPRLRPRTFYDIVVEVALIRPGPIQGNSVNPYINRRRGREAVTYDHPLLRPALEKTLGVPLFQEQLMQIAIDTAGFTPAEADQLRKAMGSKRSMERMEALRERLLAGMARQGIDRETGMGIYEKLRAFADFGFPESHAFSFAYLVYASAWLKVHHPESFYAGLLAAQPMGFYSPQSLVADARRHNVRIARPDVTVSGAEACVEVAGLDPVPNEGAAVKPGERVGAVRPHADLVLRLGLASIRGMDDAAQRIVDARVDGPFESMADLARRAQLRTHHLEALAHAGALESLGVSRREGLWAAGALGHEEVVARGWIQPTLPGTAPGLTAPDLPSMTEGELTVADVESTGISTAIYPTAHMRPQLRAEGISTVADLLTAELGRRMRVGGVVTHRQRPHTARGVTFISLEDETGLLNVVCSAGLWRTYRTVALRSKGLVVRGIVERGDNVTNFVADALYPLDLRVPSQSRDFR